MYKRKFDPFGLGRITVLYTEYEHSATDNEITVYEDFKISIHLTDGLFGVLNDRLVGGKTGDVSFYAPDEIHFGRFSRAGNYRFVTLLLSAEFLKSAETELPEISELFSPLNSDRVNCVRGDLGEKTRIVSIAESLAEIAMQNKKTNY